MPRRIPPPSNFKVWTDLLPEEGVREHGRHIYMFRNVLTNQIVYSHQPRVIQRTLKQIPFLGKKTVPASVRQDHWTTYCRVGPFPTPRQGLVAMKQLHEFRKIHELSWHKTNPKWKSLEKKTLLRRIMDQRANSVADLAKVLFIQEGQIEGMQKKVDERTTLQEAFLKKKWDSLEEEARSIDNGAIEELEKKIRDCKSILGERKDDPKEAKRLNDAMTVHRSSIKQKLWAKKMVEKRDKAQVDLEAEYAAQMEKVNQRKQEIRLQGKPEEADAIPIPEKPENKVRTQFIPPALKPLPKPYKLDGIECHWADLQTAEFAESWPETLVHDTLSTVTKKRKEGFITEIEAKDNIKQIQRERISAAKKLLGMADPLAEESEPKPKTGIWKYMPNVVAKTFRPSI